MGRPERPIEETAGEIGRFAADLRRMREDAGRPTYAAMARRGGVSRSALAGAAAGRSLPRWRTVEAYVRSCDGDLVYWQERWEAVGATGEDPTSDSAEPDSRGVTRSRRGARAWRIGAVVTTTVAIVGIVLWLLVPTGDHDGIPSETEQPIFSEDFGGTQLNLQRWFAPSDPAHLFPRNNVLNMVGSTNSGDGVDVDLTPQDIGAFREIDFVLGVPEYPRPGSGGGSLILTEPGGRTQKLVFGASPGPIPLSVVLLACSRPTCENYDDYEPPAPPTPAQQFTRDEAVPIKIVQQDDAMTVWMRDVKIAEAQVTEPLASFRFNGYAEPGEQWRITVDAVRAYR